MKSLFIIIVAYLLLPFNVLGQEFNKSINKDSLLNSILKNLPEKKKTEFLEAYNSGNDKSKEFLLFMFSMPRSSKNELISNIDLNYQKINDLKKEYKKMVPNNYTVSIEFNPENKIVNTKESIDLAIVLYKNKQTTVTQDWNLAYDSDKLREMLHIINWNSETLKKIKVLLANAHCISVENGEEFTIGFGRSGLGKYSYILFDDDLTSEQVKKHNDGCNNIYYKKNIVLKYEGGAAGPQCFPD